MLFQIWKMPFFRDHYEKKKQIDWMNWKLVRANWIFYLIAHENIEA